MADGILPGDDSWAAASPHQDQPPLSRPGLTTCDISVWVFKGLSPCQKTIRKCCRTLDKRSGMCARTWEVTRTSWQTSLHIESFPPSPIQRCNDIRGRQVESRRFWAIACSLEKMVNFTKIFCNNRWRENARTYLKQNIQISARLSVNIEMVDLMFLSN